MACEKTKSLRDDLQRSSGQISKKGVRCSLLLTILLAPVLCRAGILDDLSSAQRADVLQGRQVVLMNDVEGQPWPRIRVYDRIRATPEEVAAVFCDYKEAKLYIPKVIKSDVSKNISPGVVEVDYGVDVMLLPDEYYTARNSVRRTANGYSVSWSLVRALQTKASEGELLIEPNECGSIIRYTNLVTPASKMAGLLRGPAIEQMKETVLAIVARVEKQQKTNPIGLARQVAALRASLGEAPPNP